LNSIVDKANQLSPDLIAIVGDVIDEDTGKRFSGVGADLAKAMERCDVNKPTILLSHQPLCFDDAVSRGVNLQLSGHAHAGRIPPLDLITMLYFKYPYGLYQKGSSFIYTTCGTGT
jgi:predicted MPP superfamily phosphohydrolase